MSSLIINFDKSLKVKSIDDRKKHANLIEQKTLNLENPENFYSEYEYTENLIKEDSNNNLVNTFLAAYNSHKPLRLRPDDINLALQLVWSTCVNNNHEKFRSQFVNHAGKMELKVESELFDSNFFCQQFANLMKENVNNPDFIEQFTKEYTTTTQLIRTVTNQVLMNTLKEYFSCSMILGCGISKVIMEGTKDDWKKLNDSYKYFKNFFAETELKPWFVHFDMIMEYLILMRELQDEGEVDALDDLKEFWLRVICYVPQGSGSQTILGGWVRLLTPYSSTNKIIGMEKPILCLDLSKKRPEYSRDYRQQDVLARYYEATEWYSLQSSSIVTPAKLYDYDGTLFEVEFSSGFFPPVERDDGTISTNIGFLMRTNKEIEKKKLQRHYCNLGVNESNGRLKIPRTLRREQTEIAKIFDVFSSELYGEDPEEVKKKEELLADGVYIDIPKPKSPSHIVLKKLMVPKKYEEIDEEKKIKFQREMREIFGPGQRIVYY